MRGTAAAGNDGIGWRRVVVVVSHVRRVRLQDGWMEDITDDGRRRYREQGGNTNFWATSHIFTVSAICSQPNSCLNQYTCKWMLLLAEDSQTAVLVTSDS